MQMGILIDIPRNIDTADRRVAILQSRDIDPRRFLLTYSWGPL